MIGNQHHFFINRLMIMIRIIFCHLSVIRLLFFRNSSRVWSDWIMAADSPCCPVFVSLKNHMLLGTTHWRYYFYSLVSEISVNWQNWGDGDLTFFQIIETVVFGQVENFTTLPLPTHIHQLKVTVISTQWISTTFWTNITTAHFLFNSPLISPTTEHVKQLSLLNCFLPIPFSRHSGVLVFHDWNKLIEVKN